MNKAVRIWNLEKIPWLAERQYLDFQVGPECGDLIAIGGNLSPGLLLSAYRQGLFPWYGEGEDICWWSPQKRFVLFPHELHLSKSLRRQMKRSLPAEQASMRLSLDRAFPRVIQACAGTPRPGQLQPNGSVATWILPEMQRAYLHLHRRGYAHSVECWQLQPDGSECLAGGLYGIGLGHCFYGESMFRQVPAASKIALAALVLFLRDKGFGLIDCQQETEHLRHFGARLIPRGEFEVLQKTLQAGRACWKDYREEFPASPSLARLLQC